MYRGRVAIVSTKLIPSPSTRPKAVKPPFWLSRLPELSARFTKNWLVALFGSPPSFAMARVPRTFVLPGSFTTGPN